MQGLATLLVLVLDAASAQSPTWLHRAAAQAAAGMGAVPAPLATPVAPSDDGAPPPCAGEVCQPQVALPGYTPQFSMRGARTQLTMQALDAVRLEPVTTVAWWIAATGLRLDYTPAAMDAAASGGVGVAHFQVLFRWRMDAFGGPDWLRRGANGRPAARPPAP